VNEKILFVGFLQACDRFDLIEPPKSQFEHLEHQYILTDKIGYIANVTEGLNFELGLNSKFFDCIS
jgi:hypothetical protein